MVARKGLGERGWVRMVNGQRGLESVWYLAERLSKELQAKNDASDLRSSASAFGREGGFQSTGSGDPVGLVRASLMAGARACALCGQKERSGKMEKRSWAMSETCTPSGARWILNLAEVGSARRSVRLCPPRRTSVASATSAIYPTIRVWFVQ
jgi:hypothetical protein